MKPSWEWTEDDLLALIAGSIKENIGLDYKACAALQKTEPKKDEVSKDVSAFANSAGGTIVYGMVEDKQVPLRVDAGFDPLDISREWLEQVINSRIQRRIDGVLINQVDTSKTNPGRVAYVVHVPQSDRAPHQAADKKFYKRFNFQSVPMEEYEVRDVARRTSRPRIELAAVDALFTFSDSSRIAEAHVEFRASNQSAVMGTFVVITVGMWDETSASLPAKNEWRWLSTTDHDWKVVRLVVASGSCTTWSPLTPGFTLVSPRFTLRTPNYERDILAPRIVALVRLDHDGGTVLYRLEYNRNANAGERLRLLPGLGDPHSYLRSDLEMASWFSAPTGGSR